MRSSKILQGYLELLLVWMLPTYMGCAGPRGCLGGLAVCSVRLAEGALKHRKEWVRFPPQWWRSLDPTVATARMLAGCHPTTRILARFPHIPWTVIEEPTFLLEELHELLEGRQRLRIAATSLFIRRFQLSGKLSRRHVEEYAL
ncbi:hypothetical protein EVAR_18421_1 [Eumeta japonica]|uniref:Secreted protein n=1 Tax=Eumeta variegata TaxID=151549 RepID=A0A4C1UTZ7_EUMVA|nr:hypothetical protein EVAR_18421_1 [Eumeta japonica]